MGDEFDPYYKWLGIPPGEQPPNHYRLLGIQLFETDPDVIQAAADRQMSYLQELASGPEIKLAQKLLNEISNARVWLLNGDKKQKYDVDLRAVKSANVKVVNEIRKAVPLQESLPSAAPIINTDVGTQSGGTTRVKLSTKSTHARSAPTKKKALSPLPAAIAGVVVLLLVVVIAVVALIRGNDPLPTPNAQQRDREGLEFAEQEQLHTQHVSLRPRTETGTTVEPVNRSDHSGGPENEPIRNSNRESPTGKSELSGDDSIPAPGQNIRSPPGKHEIRPETKGAGITSDSTKPAAEGDGPINHSAERHAGSTADPKASKHQIATSEPQSVAEPVAPKKTEEFSSPEEFLRGKGIEVSASGSSWALENSQSIRLHLMEIRKLSKEYHDRKKKYKADTNQRRAFIAQLEKDKQQLKDVTKKIKEIYKRGVVYSGENIAGKEKKRDELRVQISAAEQTIEQHKKLRQDTENRLLNLAIALLRDVAKAEKDFETLRQDTDVMDQLKKVGGHLRRPDTSEAKRFASRTKNLIEKLQKYGSR